MIVAIADLEVALEQVDYRQVAGGLAVGHRRALHEQPALHPMRVSELVGEPRLAHARLAHDGHHLAAARTRLTQHPAQIVDLGVAAHEAREPPDGRGLQPRARHSRPGQLVDLHRPSEAFHRDRPERPYLDVTLRQIQGRWRK
jgi:hypothetical protein